ncbi:hypothetical protein GCM10022215_31300 [Nocardioides fonticola]|uniref:TetR family transcriptional regulator n=2 Tax=Nocardioides fonticola TaxID=450363 RepID=A0ABP7XQV6_9ACTN
MDGVTGATILHSLNGSAILHYMSESAISLREAKKAQTLRRIRQQALELTRDRGLEGWTMDDLAELVEVSRRTLFNYVPGKIDAILGEPPAFPDDALAVFRAGGPTGRLVDDMTVLAVAMFERDDFGADLLPLAKQVFAATPRLILIAHERFEVVAAEMVGHILEREGESYGSDRALLAVRVLAALFDVATYALAADPDGPPLAERFEEAVDQARALLT